MHVLNLGLLGTPNPEDLCPGSSRASNLPPPNLRNQRYADVPSYFAVVWISNPDPFRSGSWICRPIVLECDRRLGLGYKIGFWGCAFGWIAETRGSYTESVQKKSDFLFWPELVCLQECFTVCRIFLLAGGLLLCSNAGSSSIRFLTWVRGPTRAFHVEEAKLLLFSLDWWSS